MTPHSPHRPTRRPRPAPAAAAQLHGQRCVVAASGGDEGFALVGRGINRIRS
jgi:hypothetical protein